MRILVVEDAAKLAELLRRGLVEQGYLVDVTGEETEAVSSPWVWGQLA